MRYKMLRSKGLTRLLDKKIITFVLRKYFNVSFHQLNKYKSNYNKQHFSQQRNKIAYIWNFSLRRR